MKIFDFRCSYCGKEFESLSDDNIKFDIPIASQCCEGKLAIRIPSAIQFNFLGSMEKKIHGQGQIVREPGIEREVRWRKEEKEEKRIQAIRDVVTETVMQYDLPGE